MLLIRISFSHSFVIGCMTVCELPVAKRNFVKRHGHSMVQSSKELKETVDRLVSDVKKKRILPVVSMDSSVASTSFIEMSTDDDSLDGLDLSCHDFSRAVTPVPCHEDNSELVDIENVWMSTQHVRPVSLFPIDQSRGWHVESMRSEQPPVYVVIPPSPSMHARILSPKVDGFVPLSAPKVVPLVEPGKTITEWEFADAIHGIDFAKVFD